MRKFDNKLSNWLSSPRLQHIVSIVLILVLAVMAGWLSHRYSLQADWTAGNRNSLTEPSKRLLTTMPDEIKFTGFVFESEQLRGDIRQRIETYQRVKDNISLEFIDPATNPQLAREMNIGMSGELVVEYQGRRENLRYFSEQAITSALQRLAYAGEQWVVFIEGHKEHDISSEDQTDYQTYAEALKDKGLKVKSLNLAETPEIPANTSVLVIASPQTSYLPGEVQLIRDYVAAGGNLLWLDDPGPRLGLEPLAQDLEIDWQPGTLVFPDYQILGTGHPAIALVTEYRQPHPITRDLAPQITLFPFAGALKATEDSVWGHVPFLTTPERTWRETAPLEGAGNITFDEQAGDEVGPFAIGMALERPKPKAEEESAEESEEEPDAEELMKQLEKREKGEKQRIAVIADSDFLANNQINALGNMQLGLNLVQWLAMRDAQISINVPPAPDTSLQLAPWILRIIGIGFVIVLPVIFLIIGVGRWWLRRRR